MFISFPLNLIKYIAMSWAGNNEGICNTGLFLVDNVKIYILV